jgi:hypothetical protein
VYEAEALLIECKPGTRTHEGAVGALECVMERGKVSTGYRPTNTVVRPLISLALHTKYARTHLKSIVSSITGSGACIVTESQYLYYALRLLKGSIIELVTIIGISKGSTKPRDAYVHSTPNVRVQQDEVIDLDLH